MSVPQRPHIVIATPAIESNPPALRLIRICAEFGRVTVITNQKGSDNSGGLEFQRVVPRREWFFRGLAAIARRVGRLLPARVRIPLVAGWLDKRLGIAHHGSNFRKTWCRHGLSPALLVLDGAEFMTTAGRLARRAGSGLVYYVHEMVPNEEEQYTRCLTAWLCRLERRECCAASHIIVQHQLWGKLLRRRYRLPAGKFTEVTPSPQPQEPLPGSSAGEPLRLYYHGYYLANRGLAVVVQAVGLVPDVQLDLRGYGPYEAELRNLATQSGAGERIRFLPPLPTADLAASAREYDLGLVTGTPAHLNGRMSAGVKLYENISAGIGLLGYRSLTLRNTARRLGIGFNYDDTSPESVAETLRYCAAHREAVASARQRAVAVARGIYNSDAQDERLRLIVAQALRAAAMPSPSAT